VALAVDETAGYLYLGAAGNSSTTRGIFRLALTDGSGAGALWFATTNSVNSAPVLDSGGNLYFGSARGSLYSVNAAGTQRWKIDGMDTDNGSIAIGGDNALYFTSSDGWAVKVANATSPVVGYHSNTWKIKYVVVREARIGSSVYWERIGPNQETIIDAKMQQFADRVLNEYSQGILTVQLTKQVLEVVGTGFESECGGADGYFYKGTDRDATVTSGVNTGDYDNIVYWWGGDPKPTYTAIGACGIWGINWTSRDSAIKNANRMSIHFLGNGADSTGYDHLEVIEHEWEHGIIDLALPNYGGFIDVLVPDTHDGWGLRQMKPQMWSEASVADPVTSPYIATWLTAGCYDQAPQGGFPGGGPANGNFYQYIPETTLQPDTGDTTGGKTWTKRNSATSGIYIGQLDLFGAYSPDPSTKDCVAYLLEYVKSPSDQQVRIYITASSDIRVYLNGRPVRDTNDLRVFAWGVYGNSTDVNGTRKDVYAIQLDLKTGWNRVMIKSASKATYFWRAGARIGDWSGGTVGGLTYCADKPGSLSCPL
ncbi:MAG: PQQ-binding-like beta-propeller repeat protein, partial [bacterium]